MEIQKCAKCKKRPAVVFISRLENGTARNEGLCLLCAKELGIKPIDDMMQRMGISEEDLRQMSEEMNGLLPPDMFGGSEEDGGAPAVDLPKIFSELGIVGEGGQKDSGKRKKETKGEEKEPQKKFLSTYCTNLNAKAMAGQIDKIVGRDRELARVIQILCRRQKNNPCLIGEPGVGKTAIAEALAQRIVEGKVPAMLRDFEIWLLDLTSLVSGTQFRGQFEQRILALIREVKAAGNIILMIDEVHNIVGAGDAEGSMSAANILKPALSRGEIRVIGATTLKEYRKHIEKDSALERRFQPVMVEEPSVEDTVHILLGVKKYYEDYHGVKIPEDVARFAVHLSERYITDRFLPDKAIDLIDEAASHLALHSPELNEYKTNEKTMTELRKKQEQLEQQLENESARTEQMYGSLANTKAELLRLEQRQEALRPLIESLSLTQDSIAEVIEVWTGVPATDIKKTELGELRGLRERIRAELIGQEEAIDAVVRAVRRKRAGVSYRKNPVSMIFAGPTGVGKTELVKVLSGALFQQPESLIRLDMSEFMEKHAVSRIIGAPPGYVGYDEAGQLTEKVRRRPYCVILFDEIEKAHPDVMNILLQILDDGKITDAQGRVVNFENTIIIMTTNAGSEVAGTISGFGSSKQAAGKERTERALASFLRPEFMNRVDEIITFRHLNEEDFEKIAMLMLSRIVTHLSEKGIRLSYAPEVVTQIAKGSFSEKYGARNMRRHIEKHVEDPIAALLIDSETRVVGIHLYAENDTIQLQSI